MKTFYLLLIASAYAAWSVSAGAQQPQADAADKAGSPWVIRTYRVEPLSLRNILPLAIGESIPPSPPGTKAPVLSDFPISPHEFLALPSADASEKEWAAHIERTSTVLARILDSLGAPGLRDHAFLYDARTSTLAVRTTKDALGELEPVMKWLNSKIPHDLTFVVHVVQADTASIRSLVEETTGLSDHTLDWKRCTEWLATGKAKSVGRYQWDSRCGMKAELRSGQESVPLKALQVDASGRVLAIRDEPRSAVHLEADPEDPADKFSESTLQIVDVPFHFCFDYAPPVERMEKITGLLGNSTIEAPMLDYEGTSLNTRVSMYVGTQRLLTVWRPRGKPEFAGGDVMQAAFLQVIAQPVCPPENTNLADLLRKHAGPPPALPKTTPAASSTGPDPSDIYRRVYKVPSRFAEVLKLPEGDSDVKEKLEVGGITFPEDSGEATYLSATNSLMVRTTHASYERLEAYIKEVSGPTAQLASTTAYLIEGDSAAIQELAAQTRGQADHSQTWARAQKLIETNALRVVEVTRSEARLNHRASLEFGTTRHNAGEILLKDPVKKQVAPSGNEKENETKPAKDNDTPAKPLAVHDKSAIAANTPVTLEIENSFEGTRMEWETLENTEDRETVELLLQFYHDTAPIASPQPAPSPGAIIPAGLPKTRFHYSGITSMTKIRSGTTRLMGSWKKGEATAPDGRELSQALFLRVDVIPFEAQRF